MTYALLAALGALILLVGGSLAHRWWRVAVDDRFYALVREYYKADGVLSNLSSVAYSWEDYLVHPADLSVTPWTPLSAIYRDPDTHALVHDALAHARVS